MLASLLTGVVLSEKPRLRVNVRMKNFGGAMRGGMMGPGMMPGMHRMMGRSTMRGRVSPSSGINGSGTALRSNASMHLPRGELQGATNLHWRNRSGVPRLVLVGAGAGNVPAADAAHHPPYAEQRQRHEAGGDVGRIDGQ